MARPKIVRMTKEEKVERNKALKEVLKKRDSDITQRVATLKKYISEDHLFKIINLGDNEDCISCEAIDSCQLYTVDAGSFNAVNIFVGDTLMISTGYMLPSKINRDNNEVKDKPKNGVLCLIEYNGKLLYGITKVSNKGDEAKVTGFVKLNCTNADDEEIPADDCILIGKIEYVIRRSKAKKSASQN